MLKVNKTLTHLDLSCNALFSDFGAHCIFQGLQHNTTLVSLDLSGTQIAATEDTVKTLTKMLDVNKTHILTSRTINYSQIQKVSPYFKVFNAILH